MAGAATALVLVTGAGASSAIFVDYLADRARLRAYAAATKKPAETTRTQERTTSTAPVKAASAERFNKPSAPEVKTAAEAPAKTSSEMPVTTSSIKAAPPPIVDTTKLEAMPQAASIALAAKAAAAAGSLPGAFSSGVELGKTTVAAGSADGSQPDETLKAALAPEFGVEAEGDSEPVLATSEADPGDEAQTGAIPAPRPVDDTAAETASLPDKAEEQPPKPKATGRTARVLKYVNLRSRPADESKVLTVVPAKAKVNVLSCKGWCKVEYEGTQGFIYKSFIDRS